MENVVQEARNLLDLVGTPSALVSGTLLAFAGRAVKENETRVDRTRMIFGSLAALAAIGVTGALTALMLPIAWRSVAVNRGGVNPTLAVYVMIFLAVCGTLAYAMWMTRCCIKQLRRPSR